jgi:hypothetical protein
LAKNILKGGAKKNYQVGLIADLGFPLENLSGKTSIV